MRTTLKRLVTPGYSEKDRDTGGTRKGRDVEKEEESQGVALVTLSRGRATDRTMSPSNR